MKAKRILRLNLGIGGLKKVFQVPGGTVFIVQGIFQFLPAPTPRIDLLQQSLGGILDPFAL